MSGTDTGNGLLLLSPIVNTLSARGELNPETSPVPVSVRYDDAEDEQRSRHQIVMCKNKIISLSIIVDITAKHSTNLYQILDTEVNKKKSIAFYLGHWNR